MADGYKITAWFSDSFFLFNLMVIDDFNEKFSSTFCNVYFLCSLIVDCMDYLDGFH